MLDARIRFLVRAIVDELFIFLQDLKKSHLGARVADAIQRQVEQQ